MVRLIINNPIIKSSAINVNIPCIPSEQIKGVCVVRQGQSNIIETFEKRVDPRENTYYWISGGSASGDEAKDTDVAALAAGFITITPIQYDLTRYDSMDTLGEIVKKDISV